MSLWFIVCCLWLLPRFESAELLEFRTEELETINHKP